MSDEDKADMVFAIASLLPRALANPFADEFKESRDAQRGSESFHEKSKTLFAAYERGEGGTITYHGEEGDVCVIDHPPGNFMRPQAIYALLNQRAMESGRPAPVILIQRSSVGGKVIYNPIGINPHYYGTEIDVFFSKAADGKARLNDFDRDNWISILERESEYTDKIRNLCFHLLSYKMGQEFMKENEVTPENVDQFTSEIGVSMDNYLESRAQLIALIREVYKDSPWGGQPDRAGGSTYAIPSSLTEKKVADFIVEALSSASNEIVAEQGRADFEREADFLLEEAIEEEEPLNPDEQKAADILDNSCSI